MAIVAGFLPPVGRCGIACCLKSPTLQVLMSISLLSTSIDLPAVLFTLLLLLLLFWEAGRQTENKLQSTPHVPATARGGSVPQPEPERNRGLPHGWQCLITITCCLPGSALAGDCRQALDPGTLMWKMDVVTVRPNARHVLLQYNELF